MRSAPRTPLELLDKLLDRHGPACAASRCASTSTSSRHKGALDKSIGEAIMALNAASRLEGLTQRYGVGILVGEATRQRVQEVTFRGVDRVVCEPFAQMLRAYRWLI